MAKINKFLSALVLSSTTYLAGTTSASAFSLNIIWSGTGDVSGTYSLTGSFTGNNTVVDDFIRSSDIEISDFVINFRQDPSTPLASYNFAQISTDPSFNFNYQISTNTILQTGFPGVPTGFSIGNSVNGYSLDSGNGSKLSFNDFTTAGDKSASGGVLTATPVPFEFETGTGLLILGAWFGRKKVMTKIKSWRSKG